MSDILDAMRIICNESGLSNQTIGDLSGMDRATIYQIRHSAKGTMLDKIEDVFDALGYDILIKKRKE